MKPTAHKLAAEARATFFLVLMGTGAIVVDGATGRLGHLGVSLAFGLVVMAMIHAVGHVSGAHMNPAVTAAFAASGRFPARSILPYWGAQLLGAVAASLALRLAFPVDQLLGATIPSGSPAQSFAAEATMSFMLMFVVMAVSTESREQGMMAGVAVGATVALEALVGGPISGASMNPARSIAPALVSGHTVHLWIYCSAPVLGACAGAWAYKRVRGESA